jgi:gluconolactonase
MSGKTPSDLGPVERVATGMAFTEGPVWLDEHRLLLFTDIPASRIMSWGEAGLAVWLEPSHAAIGLARDAVGRVLVCEHTTRSLTAYDVRHDGSPGDRHVLAASADGRSLNSTNDVALAPDGSIWFTDPPFGVRAGPDGGLVGYEQVGEQPGCWVWRVGEDPASPEPVVRTVHRPNGLAFSPDGQVLYVSDSSQEHHRVHAVRLEAADGSVEAVADDVLWTMPVGVPDGIRVDAAGRLWVAGGDGVYVVSAQGDQLAHLPVPEMVTNLCLVETDGVTRLYATAVTSLYTAVVGPGGQQ